LDSGSFSTGNTLPSLSLTGSTGGSSWILAKEYAPDPATTMIHESSTMNPTKTFILMYVDI
jgi:hypothetical protein